jgi:hypothetical protein
MCRVVHFTTMARGMKGRLSTLVQNSQLEVPLVTVNQVLFHGIWLELRGLSLSFGSLKFCRTLDIAGRPSIVSKV